MVERRPADRLSTRALSLGTPLGLLTVASLAGSALAPELLAHHPLLLIALAPRSVFLVAAAPRIGMASFVFVGTLRLAAADPFHFALGRQFLGHRFERHRRVIARVGLPVVAVHPTGPVLAAAGAAGLRPTSVAAADVAGTIVQLALLHELGQLVTVPPALAMAAIATAAVVVGLAALGAAVRRRRRARPGRPTPAGVLAEGGGDRPAGPRSAPRLPIPARRRRTLQLRRSRPATDSSGGIAPAPSIPVAASASA